MDLFCTVFDLHYICKKKKMKETIAFLKDLSNHNDREWFNANKDRYLKAQAEFNDVVEQVILGISQFDPTVAGLTAKDCTYRIYRDLRFTKDKSPYKTHLGAYICRGGKKSGYSGYYFHVGVGGKGYPKAHMIAVGDYCADPKVLKILREDICYGGGDFDDIIKHKVSPLFHLDEDNATKRVPAGFPADSPYAEYLKLKYFCLYYEPDNKFMTSKELPQNIAELCRTTYPFLQYINRAIDYLKESK